MDSGASTGVPGINTGRPMGDGKPFRRLAEKAGRGVNTMLGRLGYTIAASPERASPAADMETPFHELYHETRRHSMVGVDGMYALYKAVEYVAANRIEGAVVECGVWRGGSMMLAALTLQAMGDVGRDLYLYDTFAGMSAPSVRDRDIATGRSVLDKWLRSEKGSVNTWCYSPLEEVAQNLATTGYPADRIQFVKGKVEDTIPATIPGQIAVLRLDTDWYESTYHELRFLFPRLVVGGVLIVDDYTQWTGAREATTQYLREAGVRILLNRIPRGGCIAVKQA